MSDLVRIELQPLGKTLQVKRGTGLHDFLFEHGLEFPCGGLGICTGCRVKVLKGELPITPDQRKMLSEAELSAGWRVACRCRAETDLTLEVGQWEQAILADHSTFEFVAQEGLGIAVDLGTTTIAAQLLDLKTGHVLAIETALNPQAKHGSDIMSRLQFAVSDNGQLKLQTMIREKVGSLIQRLLPNAGKSIGDICRVAMVGNTVMHHLFSGIDVEPLSRYPFETDSLGPQHFESSSLKWQLPGDPPVLFLPCVASFVGSDILAGVLATRLHEHDELAALVDLGTNGEIVVGNRDRLLCTSTAAGPAFEGARISMGMRATTGAISEVHVDAGKLRCHVLGDVPPRGICGSGLVDAVAAGLDLGLILPNGRLANGIKEFTLSPPVRLIQADIRELQLAKGAIAAGVRLLLEKWGATIDDLHTLYLAGAFGNYVNRQSAHRIGLFDCAPEKVQSAGNTALLGAKLSLFTEAGNGAEFASLRNKITHVSLAADRRFAETFAEAMSFPER